jgi:glycosyltransferase involved in cell wall biosynthesis
MPVLEAMDAGIPVIAGNSSAMPEICGDAAELIDSRNQDDLASALQRLAHNDAYQTLLVERGHRRAAQFRWVNAVAQTLATYRELI